MKTISKSYKNKNHERIDNEKETKANLTRGNIHTITTTQVDTRKYIEHVNQ